MSIDFIGRKQDVEVIKRVISAEATRLLCIVGDGGVGKTRLLIQTKKEVESKTNLRVCGIMDFDDPRFQIPDFIGQNIAFELGKDNFSRYLQELNHKLFLEKHKASPEYLSNQHRIINQAFLEEYREIADKFRVLLIFDTTDNLHGTLAPLEYISWLAKNLPNTCIIIAGRDAQKILTLMKVDHHQSREMIFQLLPLKDEECAEYLQLKLNQKHMVLPQEFRDKLLSLSRGKIILLDVAVDWLWMENLPPVWLKDLDLQSTESQDIYIEFESRLFEHLLQGQDKIDTLALLLSKVYPLDQLGIRVLLDLEEQDAAKLFQKAIDLAFVKQIPGNFIKLHDEAERIINQYIWDQVPARRSLHVREKSISYLESRSQELLSGLIQADISKQFSLYTFLSQQLRHLLNLNHDKGYELFLRDFAIADQLRSFTLQKMLLDELLPYQNELIRNGRWEFILFQAERLSREENYQQAITGYFNKLLDVSSKVNRPLYIRALIGKGNALFRECNTKDAIESLKQARQIAQESGNGEALFTCRLILGQFQYATGNIHIPLLDYVDSIKELLETGDREKQAVILSELAYLKSLQGQNKQSLVLIEQSISLWRQLCDEKNIYQEGLGKVYYMAGRVYNELCLPARALDYLSLSWDIMMSLELDEWMTLIRVERATSYYLLGRESLAVADIEWILEFGIKSTVYQAEYVLGQIEWNRGDHRKAFDHIMKALLVSEEINDARIELRCLCILTSIAFYYDWGQVNSLEDFEAYLHNIERNIFTEFPWLSGILFTNLGHIAIKCGHFEKGVDYYRRGLSNQASYQPENIWHESFSLDRQLLFVNDKINRLLSPEKVNILGLELAKYWLEKNLDVEHPEVFPFFIRWKKM